MARAARRPPSISLRARLLVGATALVVGLVFLEIAARAMFPAPPELGRDPQLRFQSDPELGFVHVPSQQGYLDDGLATINELGLRGLRPDVPQPDGSLRVLAVGDSTTFGWGVGDAETYTAQLETRLMRAAPGRQPHVVNGGVSSYDIDQSVGMLHRLVPVLQPDVVLVGFLWNDLPQGPSSRAIVANGSGAGGGTTAADGAPRTFRMANPPTGLTALLRRSRLAFALRHAWAAAVVPTDAATEQMRLEQAILEGQSSPAIDAAWDRVDEALSRVKALGESAGFEAGVVVMPIRAQVERDYPNADYQRRIAAIAARHGLFVVDPLPAFRAAADRSALFIPYDRMHMSAAGSALLADAVFDAVRRFADPGGTQ